MITTQRSKRLDGELYDNQDPNLLKEHLHVQILLHKYNHTLPHKAKTRKKLLQKILGHAPSDIVMEQPFYCDFGYNIFIGEHFYSNYNLTILDCNKVTIGDRCLIGPGVSIITVNHPLHRAARASHLEYAKPIVIGDDVWIGCGAIINPLQFSGSWNPRQSDTETGVNNLKKFSVSSSVNSFCFLCPFPNKLCFCPSISIPVMSEQLPQLQFHCFIFLGYLSVFIQIISKI